MSVSDRSKGVVDRASGSIRSILSDHRLQVKCLRGYSDYVCGSDTRFARKIWFYQDSYRPYEPNAVIQVIDYHKTYGETLAVRGLSFQVPAGAILGLVGANGAGKTTTLRALAGIIPPTQGQLRVAGHDVVRDSIHAKSKLAYVPDDPKLFDELTVWEHLESHRRAAYRVASFQPVAEQLLRDLELVEEA